MSDQDLFKNEDQPTPATPDQPPAQTDPFADLLTGIRNEQGEQKYKDVNQALEALKHSQDYIKTLKAEKALTEQERDQMKSELEKMGAIEDYVNRLKPSDPPANKPTDTPKGDGLSEERIAQLLEERLSAREREALQAANLKAVVDNLTQNFGDSAAEVIKQRAKELNTTPDELKALAQRNPTLALNLFSSGGGTKPPAPSQGTVIPNRQAPEDNPRPTFERSAVRGGMTNKELAERWKAVSTYTHKRLGVKS